MAKHKAKPTEAKKDNSVGLTVNKNNRIKAKEVLKTAKEVELQQIENGYRWVTNGKINRFVHPSKIERYTYNGYRVINP